MSKFFLISTIAGRIVFCFFFFLFIVSLIRKFIFHRLMVDKLCKEIAIYIDIEMMGSGKEKNVREILSKCLG